MKTQSKTIEIEADSLNETKLKMADQVPNGWKIIREQVVEDGSPKPHITQAVEIEADSPEEAREQIKSQMDKGLVVLLEKIIVNGQPTSQKTTADSVELAFVNARKMLPKEAIILEEKVLIPSQQKTIVTKARENEEAANIANKEAGFLGKDAFVKSVKLVVAGKKGFLGLGRELNQYEAGIVLPATVEVIYKQRIRIRFELGNYVKVNAKILVDIVPPCERIQSLNNWDEFTLEFGKNELTGRALPVQILLCCQDNETATRLSDGYPQKIDPVLVKAPGIIEFPNGQAAVQFLLTADNYIIGFLEAIRGGNYGKERLVIKGGIAVGLRVIDRYKLLSTLGIPTFGMLGPRVGEETFVWW